MKIFHKFQDRTGQCWLFNFKTTPVLKPRSVGLTTWRARKKSLDCWQLIVILSSYWSISEKGDCIAHRCLEINENGSPHIIRLKESATFTWDTKPELFRRIDS